MTPAGPYRLPAGGRIDRSVSLPFTFDGAGYAGHPGDTLASALLAAGVRTVGRSIYRGRPRGIYAAGAEEPGGLVGVESAAAPAPMVRASQVELYAGLRARGLAGKGMLTAPPDQPARYDKAYVHCEVLVVGGGPAGLAAALAAGVTGARVILVDDQPELGGDLLSSRVRLDGAPAMRWVDGVEDQLAGLPEVRVLSRTTAVGYYDHNSVVAVQRRTEHLGDAAPVNVSRQRLWHIRARRVVLATGAHERPIVFTDNDRPGVMLASAARTYVNRYGVSPGRRAVVFTAGHNGHAAAADLRLAGVEIAAVVDVRDGSTVVGTDGPEHLTAVRIARPGRDRTGRIDTVECDLLAVHGGWNPAVQLFSQSQGRLRYDDRLAAFVPDVAAQPQRSAGAARGEYRTGAAIADGFAAGAEAAALTGYDSLAGPASSAEYPVPVEDGDAPGCPSEPAVAYWAVPPRTQGEAAAQADQFVDLERDATVLDIVTATGTGMRSVEHVKRFTTVGTASDQGRTSGVVAVGVIATLLGGQPGTTGTTTFRPPYEPVRFELLAGRDRGELADPVRVTAMHDWHVANGAVFEDVGQWKRPRYYPRPGEDMAGAVLRECAAARGSVALMDASTLGKIDIRGPDSAAFLDRIYTNRMSTLRVGHCRYGLMCTADGMVFDDGVAARLGEHHFVITTTTGNAAAVLDWLEGWLQTEWPSLRVYCTSVTDHWATVALVGPRSRPVLAALAPDLAVDNESFPFMTVRDAVVGGMPARVFRVSFSGELAYELNVPSWYGLALWTAVVAAGKPYRITPYGTETMHVLRAEKGFAIVGQETDGTVTPQDLGMGWAVSRKKGDFVGLRSHRRADTARTGRKQLVGLLPDDPDEVLPEGAQLVVEPGEPPVPMVGHVTSSYRSAVLGRSFALAMVSGGPDGSPRRLFAPLSDRTVAVTVTEPVFYDEEGSRRDG